MTQSQITFQEAFRGALVSSGRSLLEVSEGAQVSQARLEALMDGTADLTVDEALRIAQLFGVSLEAFLQNPELSNHVRIAQLYSALPPLLKAQLEAYAQELTDAQDPPPQPKP